MYEVVIVGGGFAGVTAARECALRSRRTMLLEARERLGGRTWSTDWVGTRIELGGAWVHWHQPHTFSELTRAGLPVQIGRDADHASWYVGQQRRSGTIAERDEIARRGWDSFVHGVTEALPLPHAPLHALPELARFDRLTIAQRLDQLDLDEEERAVLSAELESLAHAPLQDAGAVSVLRWHALSGNSLALTQETGGRATIVGGTGALLDAIAGVAAFDVKLASPVAGIAQRNGHLEVSTRDGGGYAARTVIVAVPLNVLGAIEFTPELAEDKRRAIALGQASRGIKVMIHARGEASMQNAIRRGHPFGYLDTEELFDDGTQLLVGFGPDAENCDGYVPDAGLVNGSVQLDDSGAAQSGEAGCRVGSKSECDRLPALQASLEQILPGYQALEATAHDWLADEFSRGTWAIHRPGWYEHHHAAMRRVDGQVLLAGSDLANGWAGFIDGAIETGLRAGRLAVELSA
jgi:pseudooxynicotine dehydrogenase